MASIKRQLSPTQEQEPNSKKTKLTQPITMQHVTLNPADCNLDFDIEENGKGGQALYEKGFAYCWSGARANVGIKNGKYIFGCKIISAQPVEMEDTPLDQQHVCRVGVSRGDDAVGNLGETWCSFGYGGTGKFSNAGKFMNYGETFGVGDTIVCVVDLESKPLASIGFFKNGKWLGIAKEFYAGVVDSPVGGGREWESAIFPHVLLKNVVVEMQFGVEDGLVLDEGFKVWDCAFEHGNAVMGPAFGNTKDSELMMMVGLPASGKTMWAEKWVKEHPEKRYLLLGTNLALDQMKVQGLLRKQNYGERFDRLMYRATEIFNTLLARAAKIPRNSIIDQTNVYKSARKRKLRPFIQYRKIAVVVFPRPDVVKLRAEKRFKEMGKEVPPEAVNEMLANYVLPTSKDMPASDEFFDQVWFPELNREDSQRYLEEMKLTLQSASSLPYSSKSSVQSFASPLIQKANVGLQQNPNSPAPQAPYGYLRPQLVMGSAYPGGGLQGQPQYASGQYHSGAVPASYGNYGVNNQNIKISSDGRSPPFPGGTTGLYPNSGGVYPYGGPYQTHGIVSSERPNYESRIPSTGSSTGWNNGVVHSYYNTPETSSSYASSFGSPSTPLSCSNPGDPRYAVQVPGNPAINIHPQPSCAFSSNYSSPRDPFPYGNPVHPPVALQVPRESAYNPHGHLSSTSGSYCGTPYPRLPPGNVPPTGMQQSGGFFTPPGPRYH